MSQQSSSTSKTAQKKAHARSSLTGLQRLLLSVLATGSALLPAALAIAITDSPAPGTVIQNQATGSFTDPDIGTRNVESNIVEITVLEISGITVTPAGATEAPSGVAGEGPNQGDGTINTEDVVYFIFTITNIGNDPTQFFIPDNATITNGTLSGSIQILAYDTDGNSETALPTPVDVPAGGVTTGNALGLPEGSIAPNGTVTVRVPVKAEAGLSDGDSITVVLGDTPAGDRGNQAYNGSATNTDVYTQDNQDGDTVDVPTTSVTETEAAGDPNNGDATLHRQEASAIQSASVALVTSPVGGGPFICNSTFYITIGPGGGTNQQLFEVDRSTSTYSFNPLGPATTVAGGYPVDFDYNALAYNPTDNFIYGYINRSDAASGPYSPGNIIKIGNDGVAVSIGAPTDGTITGTFFGATILSDGTYVISSGGRFASIDLSTTPPTVINSEATVAGVRVNDIAVDPRDPVSASGQEVYAINENGRGNPDRLVILDVTTAPPTVVSQAPNLTGFDHNAGSQFVDAFGTLFYRSNTTNTLYKVDSDPSSPTYGVATAASSAPTGGNHDGASCLFATGMEKTITDTDNNPIVTAPAGEVVRYVYKIAAGNVLDISGVSFEDDLRNVAGGPPVNSTFTGDVVVSNATGTATISNSDQTLQISGLTLPGQDPMTSEGEFIIITADVLLDSALAPGTYFNQAFLTSLPPQYPPAVPSDYPPSAPYEDPTPIAVTEPLPSDPNVLLVKRITAINRGLANEQSFDSSFVDVGAPDDADNAVNWPGPPTAATIGGGTVESFIAGLSDGADDNTTVGPRDVIEYSIPFLSDGDVSAQDVLICDRIPANTTFINNAFNDLTPPFSGGGDRGIYLDYNGSIVGLTNANDGDEIASTPGNDDGIGGYYFPAGVDPAVAFPGTNINCGGPNDNGAIVVDLSDIPNATGDGIPATSYGLIRLRVAVD